MIERDNRIASLYYSGYSRRALAEAFKITTERVRQVLERHARAHCLPWPPTSMTGGFGTRCDHPKHFKAIPPHLL